MDIIQLYNDFNIEYRTEGHKHARPGWVNVECPFCTGNPGLHLGYFTDENYFHCWRCGGHKTREVIATLLHVSEYEAAQIIRSYGGFVRTKKVEVTIKLKAFKTPPGILPLIDKHKSYLKKRKFDPARLEELWGIQSIGPVSKLDEINYSHRIFIPIYWSGKLVTFQARDTTGKHPLKYLACPKDRELVNIKHIIYGKPEYWGDIGICVEGVTDVWRLGPNAFCVFGIKFTPAQVRVIKQNFKRVAVMFDDDPQAQVEAKKLISELRFRGVDAWNVEVEGDPGGLPQEVADGLVKKILK